MLNGILAIFLWTLPGYQGFATTFARSDEFLSFDLVKKFYYLPGESYCLTNFEY